MAAGKPHKGSQDTAALIAAPWALFNRPSIQLGVLKANLEQQSEIRVDCFHPYLLVAKEIGTENYNSVAANGWAGEAVFAALLFPEQAALCEELYNQEMGERKTKNHSISFEKIVSATEKACCEWLKTVDWTGYLTAGFSVCFYQLLSSLYLAKELKKRVPGLPIIFGGSSCTGELGKSLIEKFPQIDFIVDGEGETVLLELCQFLQKSQTELPDRVLSRHQSFTISKSEKPGNLASQPVPDYSPYFEQAGRIFASSPFIPEIPVEFSRGCWWNKCTFCNLNLQWCGYSYKSAEQMVHEVETLAAKHRCLDFCFTDNALPPRESDKFFSKLNPDCDYRFFAEIRATTNPDRLKKYRLAGLTSIQVGIESLSTSLLNRMKKGTSAIENIAIMKYAMAADILLEGNIITHFPTSTEQEATESLDHLDYVLPFRPLDPALFFLGFESPVYQRAEGYNISAFTQYKKYKYLFPEDVLNGLQLVVKGYRGDKLRQDKLWKPVRKKIAEWKTFHSNRTAATKKPLSYRDGGTFIIIRQELPGNRVLQHRLMGLSRKIYLYCSEIVTIKELEEKFPQLKPSAIHGFIEDLCEKRLMFKEESQILSLAINEQ